MKQEPDEICRIETMLGTVEFKHYKEYHIGDIILKDIWISSKGVIERNPFKKDKRTYRILDWKSCRIMTLGHLMHITWFLHHHNLKLSQVGKSVMIDIIMQLLKCSKRTAIDYLASLFYIAHALGLF